MVIGTYTMNYRSYYEGNSISEAIVVKADADSKEGVIISGFCSEQLGESMEIKGTFNGDYATITVASGQPLAMTDAYAVYLMNANNGETITYKVAANGNFSTNELWGYYIVKADGSKGFLEAAEGAELIKAVTHKTAVKARTTKIDISKVTLRTLSFK